MEHHGRWPTSRHGSSAKWRRTFDRKEQDSTGTISILASRFFLIRRLPAVGFSTLISSMHDFYWSSNAYGSCATWFSITAWSMICAYKACMYVHARVQRQQWPTHRLQWTIVVGTSLLKHMDEDKLRNTKVICLPGAKWQQVAKVISALPSDTAYDKMVVLAGGNDVANTGELHDTVDAYLTVITEAKKQCANITISSVLPRLNNTNFTDKIKRFNAHLCQMAEDHNCGFVNQHDGFHLVGIRKHKWRILRQQCPSKS